MRRLLVCVALIYAACGPLPQTHASADSCDCPYAEDHLEILKKEIQQLQLTVSTQGARLNALEKAIYPDSVDGGAPDLQRDGGSF